MKRITIPILLTVIALNLACSFEYIPPPAPAPTLAPAVSGTAALERDQEPLVIPTLTLAPATLTFTPGIPTHTPAPTRTPTLSVPMLMPPDDNVHCRVGPSVDWAIDGLLMRGVWTGIHGKDASGEWYQVATPNFPGRYCFVARSIVKTSGNLKDLPVVPMPQMQVTRLNVELVPAKKTIPCSELPYTYFVRVEITVDGPGRVAFQRSFDNGNAEPTETVMLEKSGLHVYKYNYTVKEAGSHWVLIELYAPNYRTSKDTAALTCTT